MIVVSYGGGTNSQGLLGAAFRRGIRPDLILFADTGSEMPGILADTIPATNEWLSAHGWPLIETVRWIRRDGTWRPLHAYYHEKQKPELPSLAYGYTGCSVKFKRQPLDRRIKADSDARQVWAGGGKVTRWVGIDAGEAHRKGGSGDEHLFTWARPLVEWDIDRDGCIEIAKAVGLPVAGKSSCWCCPAMSPPERRALRVEHPALFDYALKMEDAANAPAGYGGGQSGHRGSWRAIVDGKHTWREQPSTISCGCYDGNESEPEAMAAVPKEGA